LQQQPDNVIKIVSAACVLHNFILTRNPILNLATADREDPNTHELLPGEWRSDNQLVGLQPLQRNTSLRAGKEQRLAMMRYYNSPVGAVPWQHRLTFGKYKS
jgi:hypothetical protein